MNKKDKELIEIYEKYINRILLGWEKTLDEWKHQIKINYIMKFILLFAGLFLGIIIGRLI